MKTAFLASPSDRALRTFLEKFMVVSDLPISKNNDIDLVVFSGGTDVNPCLYGEQKQIYTANPDVTRDAYESHLFEQARKSNVPVLGICRGAQLLNVLHGGKLLQHMKNPHYSRQTTIVGVDPKDSDKTLMSACDHHQAIIPTKDSVVLWSEDEIPEIIFYPDTYCLGIQGHPEWAWATRDYEEFCISLVKSIL